MSTSDFSIYSDIASSSMKMMPTPVMNPFLGGMHYNTNLLGGASLKHHELDSDKIELLNKVKKKDTNVFYKAAAVLGVLATLGFLRFGKSHTQIGQISGSGTFWKTIKNGFSSAGRGIASVFSATGRGIKKGVSAVGKSIAAPFKAIGRGCKKAADSVSEGAQNLSRKMKNKKQQWAERRAAKRQTPDTPASEQPKKSWLSKLMFWKKQKPAAPADIPAEP